MMAIRENFSYTDMEEWLDAKRVTEIECLVPDLTGVARGKILPRVKFTDDRGMRLPEVVLGMTVTGNTPERDDAYERAISSIDSRPTPPPSRWCRGRSTRPRK
jgi:glutamine synthetase